jgi:cytochrome P450
MTMPSTASVAFPPGPRGVPYLGSFFDARRDPIALFVNATREHGDVVGLRFGPFRYVIVNHPDAIHHVLVDNFKNYTKSRNYQGIKLVLGSGLLTSEGEFWKRQRRLAQPAFHRERLAGFARMMVDDTTRMLDRWSESDDGAPFDLHEEMMRLTFRIVGRTLFHVDVDGDAAAIGRALSVVLRHADEYGNSLLPLPPWVPTPANARFRNAMSTLDELVYRIIAERRASGEDTGDLLSMLMSARDEETQRGMDDQQLRDEVITIVLAGHETTANALTWTLYLLSLHTASERRLRKEIEDVLGDRPPTLEDLPKLTFTSMVIQESMRLYPPAWALERQAIADDEVMGFAIPAGTIVGISPYTLHRHERFWENPEGFDPDRFAPERAAGRPKHAYLPFGGGPRLCIGNSFATMEAQLVLAMILQRCRLDLASGYVVRPDPVITLRPRNGVWMRRRTRGVATHSVSPPPAAESARAAGGCPFG